MSNTPARASSSRPRRTLMACAALVAAASVTACSSSTPSSPRSTAAPSQPASGSSTTATLPLNTGPAPWPNPDRVPDRSAAAGLTGGDTEVLTVHYHSHLDIFVNGAPEPVAGSIGRQDQSYFSPLHTHAPQGLIHIEAPSDQQMTLGMLFTEWGVRLTDTCVGGYCEPATPIAAYVDGQPAQGPIAAIVLRKGEEIALVIGTPPASIPKAWDCNAHIDASVENPAQCADFG